jgi:hypothetical protein
MMNEKGEVVKEGRKRMMKRTRKRRQKEQEKDEEKEEEEDVSYTPAGKIASPGNSSKFSPSPSTPPSPPPPSSLPLPSSLPPPPPLPSSTTSTPILSISNQNIHKYTEEDKESRWKQESD